jgi:pyruvate dehydrogenase E2 component (dihydrolipoamide acetyltransferase)
VAESIEVEVPDIGDFEDVEVIEVLVAAGDRVEAEDPLVTIESDKASMEIPSPRAGVVEVLAVSVGDRVSEGSPLLTLRVEEAASPAPDERPPAEAVSASGRAPVPAPSDGARPAARAPTAAPEPAPAPAPPPPGAELPHASPLVRRMARELGLDLSLASGSGPHGRILEDDVKASVREALAAGRGAVAAPSSLPAPDFSRFGPVEERALGRVRRTAARNLARAWAQVPQVTQHDAADVTQLEDFRDRHQEEARRRGARLTLLPFVMKACVQALRRFPELRSSLDPSGEKLIVKHYTHLGIAVDTHDGLLVPVVRDVEQKGLLELAQEVAALAERARGRKLAPLEMQGAVMSISSLGGIGGTGFTPIVNAPEVAVLGVSPVRVEPVWVEEAGAQGGGRFAPRRMLPLSLSYDHRVIDGAMAARFTRHLCGSLEAIENLLL